MIVKCISHLILGVAAAALGLGAIAASTALMSLMA
jgi:hypothetical protein